METVERNTKRVRVQAKYRRSLEVLETLKKGGMRTKTGIDVRHWRRKRRSDTNNERLS